MTGSHPSRVGVRRGTSLNATGNCRDNSNRLKANGATCCDGMNGYTRTRRRCRGMPGCGCRLIGSVLIRMNEHTITLAITA